jgi:type IV pilus assembly protein PilE
MPSQRPRNLGFTLMEVMITVGIVAILAAIALPFYNETVQRSKLIDATVKLGDHRAQLEKWFLDQRTFQSIPPAGTACGIPNPTPGTNDAFAVTAECNPTTYLITATGRPAYGMSASFVYTIDQANVRTSAGPTGWTSGAGCWAVRKDGSCQ